MNKTTVYRILDRFEKEGILHWFIDNDGLKRYAKNKSKWRKKIFFDLYEKITVEGTLKSLGIKGECIDVKDDIHFEKPFIPGLLPGDFCTYIFQYHI